MPGISSGLSPKIVFHNQLDWSATDRKFIPLVKFPTVHTMVDMFAIGELALSTNNSTTHERIIVQNGKTTGNQTTAAGSISSVWVAYTGKTSGTNYTFSANHWLRVAASEAGTVDTGSTTWNAHLVEGNV